MYTKMWGSEPARVNPRDCHSGKTSEWKTGQKTFSLELGIWVSSADLLKPSHQTPRWNKSSSPAIWAQPALCFSHFVVMAANIWDISLKGFKWIPFPIDNWLFISGDTKTTWERGRSLKAIALLMMKTRISQIFLIRSIKSWIQLIMAIVLPQNDIKWVPLL